MEQIDLAASAENPFGSLWMQMSNAEWVADVGLPLGVTLAALVFTFFALTTQLKHDRELVAEYRRRAAAGRLTARFHDAAREMGQVFTLQYAAATPSEEALRWMSDQYSIRNELERAIAAAQQVVAAGESAALDDMRDFLYALGTRWNAAAICGQMHLGTHPLDRLHFTLRRATGTDAVILGDFASELEAWSGRGELPSVAEHIAKQKTPPAPDIGPLQPDGSPGPGKAASGEWHEARLVEFRAIIDSDAVYYGSVAVYQNPSPDGRCSRV